MTGAFWGLLGAWLTRELADRILAATGVLTTTLRRGQAKPRQDSK